MFELQHQCNCVLIDPDYLNKKAPNFLLAAVKELNEGIDYLPWKWWATGTTDLKQFQIEIIDTIHFLFSHQIIAGTMYNKFHLKDSLDELFKTLADFSTRLVDWVTDPDVLKSVVEFEDTFIKEGESVERYYENVAFNIIGALMHGELYSAIGQCFLLLRSTGMEASEVYKTYVGKNTLNIFRAKNGYKDGTYKKMWNGQEDNVYLAQILDGADLQDPQLASNVYSALQSTYNSL